MAYVIFALIIVATLAFNVFFIFLAAKFLASNTPVWLTTILISFVVVGVIVVVNFYSAPLVSPVLDWERVTAAACREPCGCLPQWGALND